MPSRLKSANASEEETRRVITEHIQEELYRLRERTHALVARAGDHVATPTPLPPAAPLRNGRESEKDA